MYQPPYQQQPQQQPQQNPYQPINGVNGVGDESLSFQQFEYAAPSSQYPAPASSSHPYPSPEQTGGGGGWFSTGSAPSLQRRHDLPNGVTWQSIKRAFSTGGFDDEPPLLEELGVNFSHIASKSLTVMNPFKTIDRHIMDDTDLAGPLLFCFAFASFLLLSGKAHFGYIYGIATMGVAFMFIILNLMSSNGIDAYKTASVLGYSLLPIVILSCLSILLHLSGPIGLMGSAFAVLWSAFSASGMFSSVLEMTEQRLLVAYPVALLYSAFAIVTVFE